MVVDLLRVKLKVLVAELDKARVQEKMGSKDMGVLYFV